ncbi:hypothetical protein BHE74_00024713 [Ensete ventricosum]|nr:hypothetical protein GW17_00012579 [Ensete ventricosum]RWW67810.1 hypothetical protein BHE74_00024713 [Ensete ventricosum]RZR87838.1 hypothetical protein BHM03_00015315 [Ensete ventricosum]
MSTPSKKNECYPQPYTLPTFNLAAAFSRLHASLVLLSDEELYFSNSFARRSATKICALKGFVGFPQHLCATFPIDPDVGFEGSLSDPGIGYFARHEGYLNESGVGSCAQLGRGGGGIGFLWRILEGALNDPDAGWLFAPPEGGFLPSLVEGHDSGMAFFAHLEGAGIAFPSELEGVGFFAQPEGTSEVGCRRLYTGKKDPYSPNNGTACETNYHELEGSQIE